MFANLLAGIGLAALKAEARFVARRAAKALAIGAATAILVLTALGFLLAALTIWLSNEIGVIWALLVIAAVLLVIAAALQIATRSRGRPAPQAASEARSSASPAPPPPKRPVDAEPNEADESIEMPPPGSALGAVGVVAAAGFLLARQMLRPRR